MWKRRLLVVSGVVALVAAGFAVAALTRTPEPRVSVRVLRIAPEARVGQPESMPSGRVLQTTAGESAYYSIGTTQQALVQSENSALTYVGCRRLGPLGLLSFHLAQGEVVVHLPEAAGFCLEVQTPRGVVQPQAASPDGAICSVRVNGGKTVVTSVRGNACLATAE